MALHTGAAEVRDNDYFGLPLNRVARLLSAGYGEQVLLSLATQQLVRDHLPPGTDLKDLGEGGLKDLVKSEHVYQVIAPNLPPDFPPLKSLDTRYIEPDGRGRDGVAAEVVNPYKGLRAFQEADAADFFGREELTERLLGRLGEEGNLTRFLAVVGPSGSGKSSVVRAGLVPALRQGVGAHGRAPLRGSERWLVVELLPGAHPLEELEAVLLSIAVNPPETLINQLREDERGLARAIKRVLPHDETVELVLVIDQFEEVFTLVEDEATRVHFLESLHAAVTDPRGRLHLIVTLRADFFDRPLLYPDPGELMRQRTAVVLPLAADELERAIVRPAQRVGVTLEAELVATIVKDVGEQPGALPLLQYAMTELFERRVGRTMTLDAYRQSGGVLGALARRADELYAGLNDEEREAARQLFLRLVTLGEGVEDTRRRVRTSELEALVGQGSNRQALERVLGVFGKYRLLTFDMDPVTKGPTVEVAHEALIRTWGKLQEWLDASRSDLRVQRQLMAAATEWGSAGQDRSFLASGARLSQFEGLVEGADRPGGVALTGDERAYLVASVEERERQEVEEKERQAHELELARQSVKAQQVAASRLRVLLAAMSIFLVVAIVLSGFAVNRSQAAEQKSNEANTQRGLAVKSEATAQANFSRAEAQRLAAEANSLLQNPGKPSQLLSLLTVRSLNTLYTPQGDRALAGALTRQQPLMRFVGSPLLVWSVEFSPDGKYILTAGWDSVARLWDAHTGNEVRQFKGHTDTIRRATFSRDGKYVLTGSADNTAKLWDVATGKELRTFTGHTARVNGVAFSPDGKYVLTGSRDKTVRLWDAQTGQEIRQFIGHTDIVGPVAFSPDGKYVLTGSTDQTAKLWNTQTGQEVRTFSVNSGVNDAAFSPDGKYVLTGNADKAASLWDMQTGKEVRRYTGHAYSVEGVAFSPDGKYIVTGSDDQTAKLWDVETGNNLRTYSGHSDVVYDVAFSPDGKYVVTGSYDTTALLWDALSPSNPPQFIGHTDIVGSAIFSPDDRYVLITSDDKTTSLWDSQSGQELRTFTAQTNGIPSGVFSSDGKHILTADSDNTAKVWDVATGKELRIYTFAGITGLLSSALFSSDGKYIITVEDPPRARLWDAQTVRQIREFGAVGAVFSPDSKYVLTYGATEAKLLDISTCKEVRTFVGHGGEVNYGVFSADGKWIVATSFDKTAILWDAASGKEVRQFVGHAAPLSSAVLSPDDKYVLTSSSDGTARLWDAATGQELRRFADEGVSTADFSHDGKWVLTGGGGSNGVGVVKLWQVDYHDAVRTLCARVLWDFNDDERAQFEIKDKEPTCPNK